MTNINISDFFDLTSEWSSSTFQAHIIYPPSAVGKFHELSNGEYQAIDFPVVFKQKYGSKLKDVLDTGTAMLFLISEKFYSLLKDADLIGWQTFEVKVLDKKGVEVPGYYGLSITGRCGKVDYSKSEIIEKRAIPEGPLGKYRKGLHIGLDEWDGSDFCHPEGSFQLILTKKAADVIKNSDVTNVVIQNLTEWELLAYDLNK